MDFFDLVSLEEARERLIRTFQEDSLKTEEVPILESTDRVLANNIQSKIDVPQFNRSTVDGYAIRSKDSHGASESIPSLFTILGEVRMGEVSEYKVESGEAVYVATGGMIPEGADGMVMIEYTEELGEDDLMIYRPISLNENVISIGDDIGKGDIALKKGRIITPEVIGVLATLGMDRVKVYRRPRFYIISTGDEIIDLDRELDFGKVWDINSYTLYSLIMKLGGQVVGRTIVRDDYELLKAEVEVATDIADIVLISGGSSVGSRDYTGRVMDSIGGKGVFVHGISIKPGKPTIIGEGKGKLIFGLPGHPVSSIIVFKSIVEYYIRRKMGIVDPIPKVEAIMDFNVHSSPGRQTYQMVRIEERDGENYGVPSHGKSGMITLLSKSHGYIIIKSHEEGVYRGESRDVFLF